MNEVADQLWDLENKLATSLQACVSAVERLSEKCEEWFEKLL